MKVEFEVSEYDLKKAANTETNREISSVIQLSDVELLASLLRVAYKRGLFFQVKED